MTNRFYYGDNLQVLRDDIASESVGLSTAAESHACRALPGQEARHPLRRPVQPQAREAGGHDQPGDIAVNPPRRKAAPSM